MTEMTPEKLGEMTDGLAKRKGYYIEWQLFIRKLRAVGSAWEADRKELEWYRAQYITDASNLIAAEVRIEALEKDYYELLYAVATKHEGETRHQTALRYILEAEIRNMGDGRPVLAEEKRP